MLARCVASSLLSCTFRKECSEQLNFSEFNDALLALSNNVISHVT